MSDDEPEHLFAYGTLLPGEPRWHHLRAYVTDEGEVDQVVGELFDTGEGYPAAVFDGHHDGVIHGRVFRIVTSSRDVALEALDEVEGAVDGLYHRVVCTTAGGRRAWAYQYGGGLTLRPIVSGSWLERG